ncbi:hypothetical protein [Chromobacterium haemolyticum]|uniref:hypothetical protein n=1 Tax=Chromobacterium haemolyticum TaxID=394935 RepID=UPI001131386D|nr:hypothetical protein [Chromobacterium haemolyticum]
MKVFDVKEIEYTQVTRGERVHRLWRLGVGPCGKEVIQIKAVVGRQFLQTQQVTACGEVKSFFVPLSHIISTIQITTKESEAV